MSRATEKCSCGASIDVTADADHRVRTALQEWRDGHKHNAAAAPESKHNEPDHRPEGNNFATTERNYDSAPHEMNTESRRWWPSEGPYGRGISLKWSPDHE